MFDKIIFLKWETTLDSNSWEEHTNLILGMTSPDNYKIFIEFVDVNSWRFHGNGKISGFYIKDMTVRGYENNCKYEVGDYEENEIEFYCSDIIIKSLEKSGQ
jgi:hypothetical protein